MKNLLPTSTKTVRSLLFTMSRLISKSCSVKEAGEKHGEHGGGRMHVV
jgi:hypothetical protein